MIMLKVKQKTRCVLGLVLHFKRCMKSCCLNTSHFDVRIRAVGAAYPRACGRGLQRWGPPDPPRARDQIRLGAAGLSGSVALLALVRAEELSRGSSPVPLDGSGGSSGAKEEASAADPSHVSALREDSAVLAPAVTESAVGCSACAGSGDPSDPPAADSSEESPSAGR
jgi:hypothetical protein